MNTNLIVGKISYIGPIYNYSNDESSFIESVSKVYQIRPIPKTKSYFRSLKRYGRCSKVLIQITLYSRKQLG